MNTPNAFPSLTHCHRASWLAVLFALSGTITGTAVAGPIQDRTAPSVTSLSFVSPAGSTDVASQTVRFQVGLTDNLSGFNFGYVQAVSPSGASYVAPLSLVSGSITDGIAEANLIIPRFAVGGDYDYSIYLMDATNNGYSYTDNYLQSIGLGDPLTIIGTGDASAPSLASISSAPQSIDVSLSAATVQFFMGVLDNLSGFSFGYIQAVSPNGSSYVSGLTLTSGTTTDAVLSTSLTIPQFAPSGTYSYSVYLMDAANNGLVYNSSYLASIGFSAPAVVGGDSEAPSPTSIVLSPPVVDTSRSSQTVNFSIGFLDNLSGFNFGYVQAISPTGSSFVQGLNISSGSSLLGTLEGTLVLPMFSPIGIYDYGIYLSDAANNGEYYSYNDLLQSGFDPARLQVRPHAVSEPSPAALMLASFGGLLLFGGRRKRPRPV